MSNLKLWNSHRTPHKDATKKFQRGGGFRGTAIDPMWLIREATSEWGPIGSEWGFEVMESENIAFDGKAEVLNVVLIKVWYPGGIVESYGHTMLAGTNKNGFFVDDEAPKKSLTDALSKALSWLGFGADVHMGMFDGNKYADLKGESGIFGEKKEPPQEEPKSNVDNKEVVDDLICVLRERFGDDDARVWHQRTIANFFNKEKLSDMTNDELGEYAKLIETKIKNKED